MGVANSTMGIRNFIYEEVKLEGGGEISLNQSLIYEHIFPHSRHILFVYPSSTMQPKKKLFLGTKIMGGDFPTLPPPSYAYDSNYTNLRGVICHKIGILIRLHQKDQPENAV